MMGWKRRLLWVAMLHQSASGFLVLQTRASQCINNSHTADPSALQMSIEDPKRKSKKVRYPVIPNAQNRVPTTDIKRTGNLHTKASKIPILPNSPEGLQRLSRSNTNNNRAKGPTNAVISQQEADLPERFLENPARTEGTQAQRYVQDPTQFQVVRRTNKAKPSAPRKLDQSSGAQLVDRQDRFFDNPARTEGTQAQRYIQDPTQFGLAPKKSKPIRSDAAATTKLDAQEVPDRQDRFFDDPYRMEGQQADRYRQDPSRFEVFKPQGRRSPPTTTKRNPTQHSDPQQHWNLRRGTMHHLDHDPNYMDWNRFAQDPTIPYQLQERSGQLDRFYQNPDRFQVWKPPPPKAPPRQATNHRPSTNRQKSSPAAKKRQERAPQSPRASKTPTKSYYGNKQIRQDPSSNRQPSNPAAKKRQQRAPQSPSAASKTPTKSYYGNKQVRQDPHNARFRQDPSLPYKFHMPQQIERFEQDPDRFEVYKRPTSRTSQPDQINDFITNPYGSSSNRRPSPHDHSIDLEQSRARARRSHPDQVDEFITNPYGSRSQPNNFYDDRSVDLEQSRELEWEDSWQDHDELFEEEYDPEISSPEQNFEDCPKDEIMDEPAAERETPTDDKKPILPDFTPFPHTNPQPSKNDERKERPVDSQYRKRSGRADGNSRGGSRRERPTPAQDDPRGGSAYRQWKRGDDRPGMYWKK